MIVHILSFKDKALKCFNSPHYTNVEIEALPVELARQLKSTEDKSMLAKFKHKVLYWLGDFDDVTGKIKVLEDPEFLLDCDDEIVEVKDDGETKNS